MRGVAKPEFALPPPPKCIGNLSSFPISATHLHSFVICVEKASFTSAGDALFLTGTAVSKQIHHLENDLGFDLFTRTIGPGGGLTLTDAGSKFYSSIRKLLAETDRLVQKTKDTERNSSGILRIAASPLTCGDAEHLFWRRALSRFPDLTLELTALRPLMEDFQSAAAQLGETLDVLPAFQTLGTVRDALLFHPLIKVPFALYVPYGLLSSLSGTPLKILSSSTTEQVMGPSCSIPELLPLLERISLFALQPKLSPALRPLLAKIETLPFSKGKQPSIAYLQAYDLTAFQVAYQRNALLLAPCLPEPLHPLMVPIPLNEPETTPFGFYYRENAPEIFRKLIISSP